MRIGSLKLPKIGLLPRLLIAIVLGVLAGMYLPEGICRLVVTFADLFSNFLKFVIPLMILSFVSKGIADLSRGAGKLLLITLALSYFSTLGAGLAAYGTAIGLFPHFMDPMAVERISETVGNTVEPFFMIDIPPIMDTMSAVALAFILGMALSSMRGRAISDTLYHGVTDLSAIIEKVLEKVIVPLLPLYVCGTFIDMTSSGKAFAVMGILWKVVLVVIAMHMLCIVIQFLIAGAVNKRNPLTLLRNQIPGYTAALGTQSSAAAIPVNLECARRNGVSEQVRNFVVPLCANIHLAGSMITVTCCATAVCLMNRLPLELSAVIPFIVTLSIAMVAAPGAPGGAIMTALPFLHMIFGPEAADPNGPIYALMIALYITQDSFGTACNVSGDNAISVIVNAVYEKLISRDRAKG